MESCNSRGSFFFIIRVCHFGLFLCAGTLFITDSSAASKILLCWLMLGLNPENFEKFPFAFKLSNHFWLNNYRYVCSRLGTVTFKSIYYVMRLKLCRYDLNSHSNLQVQEASTAVSTGRVTWRVSTGAWAMLARTAAGALGPHPPPSRPHRHRTSSHQVPVSFILLIRVSDPDGSALF